jgi:hypothetical protein
MADLFRLDPSAAEGAQNVARGIILLGEAAAGAGPPTDALAASLRQTLTGLGHLTPAVMESVRALENIQRGAAGAGADAQKASAGISSLVGPMAGLAAQALGIPPDLAKVAGALGMLAVGGPVTVGVLAGATAIGFAWDLLTRDARRLREETKKAGEALDQIAQSRRGPGGVIADNVAKVRARRDVVSGELASIDRQLAVAPTAKPAALTPSFAAGKTGFANVNAIGPATNRAWLERRRRELVAERATLDRQVNIGEDELRRIGVAEEMRGRQEDAGVLSTLISSGHSTSADRAEARRLIAEWQRTLADEARRGGDPALRAALARDISTLSNALEQSPEARRARERQRLETEERQRALQLQEALRERPRVQLIGEPVGVRPIAPIAVPRIVAPPAVTIKSREAEYMEALRAPFDKARKGIERSFGDLFTGIVQKGASAFDDFAKTVKSIFARLISDIVSTFVTKRLKPALAGMLGIGSGGSGSGGLFGLGDSKALTRSPLVGGLAVGVGGAMVGYAVGSMTTNRTLGALGGAASGAATGAAMASVLPGIGTAAGAVIGGVMGFVGGLFGSSKKAKEAARQMREAQQQWELALKDFADAATEMPDHVRREKEINRKTLDLMRQGMQAFGIKDPNKTLKFLGFDPNKMTGSPEEIAQVIKKLEQLAGKGGPLARMVGGKHLNSLIAEMKKLAEAQGLHFDALEKARQEQEKTVKDDLAVRELAAKGLDKDAEALRLKLQHEREYQEAEKQGYDAATLAQLRHVQALEAAKQAADGLTTSMLNVPEGFRLAAAAFHAQDPFGTTTSGPPILGGWPGPHPTPTYPTLGPIDDGGRGEDDRDVVLQLDGREVARVAVHHLRRKARQQFGDETRWGEVSEA